MMMNSSIESSRRARISSSISLFSASNSSHDFLSLFEKGKWRAIRRHLRSKKGLRFVQSKGSDGLSSLSVALGQDAPIDIIKTILDLDPTLALKSDYLRANPLHIACLNGSNLASIKLLIERYPCLVKQRDQDKRIPLHHAVENICLMRKVGDTVISNSVEVVKELLNHCPETVNYSDKHGDSPLDLTHLVMAETDTSFEEDESTFSRVEFIHTLLRKISVDIYKNKKRQWEEAGYDTSKKTKVKSNSTLGSGDSTISESKSSGQIDSTGST